MTTPIQRGRLSPPVYIDGTGARMIAPELKFISHRLICRPCAPAAMCVQMVAELVAEGAEERAKVKKFGAV